MRNVGPRTGAPEFTVAEDQLEFRPLVVAVYSLDNGQIAFLSRWRFSDEEKRKIMEGEDFYLVQVTTGSMQPISPTVGTEPWMIIPES